MLQIERGDLIFLPSVHFTDSPGTIVTRFHSHVTSHKEHAGEISVQYANIDNNFTCAADPK